MKTGVSHITVFLNSQAIVNLQHDIFGLECLDKTRDACHYRISVSDVSAAVYQSLQQQKIPAKAVICDEDGEKTGEITGMDRKDGYFHLTIRPAPAKTAIKKK